MKQLFEIYYKIKYLDREWFWQKRTEWYYANGFGFAAADGWHYGSEIIYAENLEDAILIYRNKAEYSDAAILSRRGDIPRITGIQFCGMLRNDMSIIGAAKHLPADIFMEYCCDRNFPTVYMKEIAGK